MNDLQLVPAARDLDQPGLVGRDVEAAEFPRDFAHVRRAGRVLDPERGRSSHGNGTVVRRAAAAQPGDHVLIMSNGGFGGIHDQLFARLKSS